jgi:hypothetical protein
MKLLKKLKNLVFHELLRRSTNGVLPKEALEKLPEKLPQCFIYMCELFNAFGLEVNSHLIKSFQLVLLVEREVDMGVSKVH